MTIHRAFMRGQPTSGAGEAAGPTTMKVAGDQASLAKASALGTC
jgi:hypothetical protein